MAELQNKADLISENFSQSSKIPIENQSYVALYKQI